MTDRSSQSDDEEFWGRIRDRFSDHCDIVRGTRPVTREEALKGTLPDVFDPNIGVRVDQQGLRSNVGFYVKPWDLLLYRKTTDEEMLNHFIELAREVIPQLSEMIDKREHSPEFTFCWGLLCEAASAINMVYFSSGDDLIHERASMKGGAARSKEPQKQWVAQLLNRQFAAGRVRKEAEREVTKQIRRLINEDRIPAGFDKGWFDCILQGNDLRTTYQQKAFSDKKVKALAANTSDGLRPLEI